MLLLKEFPHGDNKVVLYILAVSHTVCTYWQGYTLCVHIGRVTHCVYILAGLHTVCTYWHGYTLCVHRVTPCRPVAEIEC